MKAGDKVTYIGLDQSQINWAGQDPEDKLVVGDDYIIEGVEQHSWHTVVWLQNVSGQFNSIGFF